MFALHKAVFQHIWEGSIAHLQFLILLEIHKIAFSDSEHPEEFALLE